MASPLDTLFPPHSKSPHILSLSISELLICCVSSRVLQANSFTGRLPPAWGSSRPVLQLQADEFLKSNSCTCQKLACIMRHQQDTSEAPKMQRRGTSWWCRRLWNSNRLFVLHGVVHVAVAVMICNLWISVAAKGYQSASSAWAILSDRNPKETAIVCPLHRHRRRFSVGSCQ